MREKAPHGHGEEEGRQVSQTEPACAPFNMSMAVDRGRREEQFC